MATYRRKITRIVPKLLEWYARNARDLPWRRTRDAYGVFVSEIMLQQTQVKAVLPYWERWMRALPTLRSLAESSPRKIHKLWEGLGYYTRVRNMQKAAGIILEKHKGKFPTRFEDVLELPGIGRYTAGAICSIAFNQAQPILDGNVIRVLTRLWGIAENPKEKAVNAMLWDLAHRLVREAERCEQARPDANGHAPLIEKKSPRLCSSLNQALMELGALVCTPRQPVCEVCPVAGLCVARKQGRTAALPAKLPGRAFTKRYFQAFVVDRDGKFLVRQRPAGVVNAHLWEFPNIEIFHKPQNPRESSRMLLGIRPTDPKHYCTIQHSITRYRIRLDVFKAGLRTSARVGPDQGHWLDRASLKRLPFASAHKKILMYLDQVKAGGMDPRRSSRRQRRKGLVIDKRGYLGLKKGL